MTRTAGRTERQGVHKLQEHKIGQYKLVLGMAILIIFLTFVFFCIFHGEKDEQNNKILIQQIENGDFSCLSSEGRVDKEEAEKVYSIALSQNDIEWILCDVNGDGSDELIWQSEQNTYKENMKSIVGIFVFRNNSAECVYWDTSDSTSFLFLGKTQNLIYYAGGTGIYCIEEYYQYIFGDPFKLRMLSGIYTINFSDISEINPDIFDGPLPEEGGIYYYEYFPNESDPSSFGSAQFISKSRFHELFIQMTGFEYIDSRDG